MTEEKFPIALQAAIPGGLAAVLQLAMAMAIGKLPPAAQMAGAVIVAGLVGGGVSLGLREGLHMTDVFSGILGAATGAVPAIYWSRIAQGVAAQQVKARTGFDPEAPAPVQPMPAPVAESTPAQKVVNDTP